MSEDTTETDEIKGNRRFKKRWLLLGIALLLIGFILLIWSQRIEIADRALRDQLKQYDVDVDYDIVEIGPRFQRLRNISIGDPKNPDFTAKEVDIDVTINFAGAVLRTVWVRGGFIKGRLVDGAISFGELDKLLVSDDDTPFELPDLALDIGNSKLQLDSEYGRIGVGLNGRGHLRNSFTGALAVQTNQIDYENCALGKTRFAGRIKISNQQPSLLGRLNNDNANCKDIGAIRNASIDGALNLSQNFDRWRGKADIDLTSAISNDASLSSLVAFVDFTGNAQRTDVKYDLKKAAITAAGISIGDMKTMGEGRFTVSENGYNIAALGNANINRTSLDTGTLSTLGSFENIADSSPIGPLVRIWAPAMASSAANFSGEMGYDIAFGETVNNRNIIILDNVKFASTSGARLSLSNQVQFSKNSKDSNSDWRINSPIGFALRGGKLPSITANVLQGRADRWSGQVQMPAYIAGGALLALKELKFSGSISGGWDFSGFTTMSGAIPTGRVEQLALPIDGKWSPSGGFSLLEGCKNIIFAKLQTADFSLKNQNLRICPDGGSSIIQSGATGLNVAARTENLSIDGILGASLINVQSAGVSFSLAGGVNATDVRITFGENDTQSEINSQTIFTMEQLTADFSGPYITGQANGGTAKIGTVPLEMDSAQIEWRFEDNILSADGSLMVRDAQQVDRFEPVSVPDLLLSLENGEIAALAQVQEPNTKRKLADVDIMHKLSDSSGRALFSVDNLTFNDELQPEQLTNIVLGVVANVQGAINGDGSVVWNGDTVTSTGKFSTRNLDLAAAFGPVRGLAGEISLSDLINFESEDRQILTLASVNPGVEVLDGRISYQLLPGQKIQIYGGSWPFSGGRMVLEPTIWDLAENVERKMTFEVTGMDAAVFLDQFEFASLSATGLFDGRLPMVFNSEGGRIVGGSLVSVSGGNFSYTDGLAAQDLSAFGNYAFDTLKSIDYETLTVDMDGNIDGEIVTGVKLAGLKQGAGANKNFITKQLAKIPLEFNVKIEASFLDLLYLVEGVGDPDATIRRYAPTLLAGDYSVVTNEQPVQPIESKDSP